MRLPFQYGLFLATAQRRARTRALRNPGNITGYVQQLSTWYDQNTLFTDTRNLEGFQLINNVLS